MRRIFTPAIAFVCLFASVNANAQTCTQTTDDFTGASTTNGFSGARRSGTGTFSALAPASGQIRSTVTASSPNVYAITSPTYFIPNAFTQISFQFAFGKGSQATLTGVEYAIRYTSSITNTVVETTPVAYTTGVCTSVAKPADFSGNTYQIVALYSVTTGNGNPSNGYIFFDDFGTNGTLSAIALPVRFAGLQATAVAGAVNLTWSVDVEINVKHYEVERSADGVSYTAIGTVATQGLRSYSFVDASPIASAYYRIKSVDVDGKLGYSTIVSLKGGKSSVVVKAFMSDRNTLTVQHDVLTGARVAVAAADGRIVKSQLVGQGAQQTKIDLSGAQSGLYIVRLETAAGAESIKIMKQ